MATFAYVGRSKSGAVKKGELAAKSRDEAVDQLRRQSVVVTSLEEKGTKEGFKLAFGNGMTEKDLRSSQPSLRMRRFEKPSVKLRGRLRVGLPFPMRCGGTRKFSTISTATW
jgi:hypothetical protein